MFGEYLTRVLCRDDGAVSTEYALLITLIAAVIITLVFDMGRSVAAFFQHVATSF